MRRLAAVLFAALPALAGARDRPPPDLLASNMAECPYTALVRIEHTSSAQAIVDDKGHAGYVTLRLDVTVIESFSGTAHDTIALYQTVEAPAHPPHDGERWVVSFRLGRDGRFVVPDNGYVFPDDADIIRRARELGRRTPTIKH